MPDIYTPNIADILYGSYIRYDRLYEMSKYAFHGDVEKYAFSNEQGRYINIYVDCYSILRSLYAQGSRLLIKDSYVIASCLINLAIHLRAYFETRHRIGTNIYLIYGGARPPEAFSQYKEYNSKNILMEDSNQRMKELIIDNFKVMELLCPYLVGIYCIMDPINEFGVISSYLIDKAGPGSSVIYSKDQLSYSLVAFLPYTYLFRPKKRGPNDNSWVVTKSTLYNAYRYGELGLVKEFDTSLNVKMFSILQSISGVRTRSINSIKNINSTIKLLEKACEDDIFCNGFNASAIFYLGNPFEKLFDPDTAEKITKRFAAIDLLYQTSLYSNSVAATELE